MAIKETLGFSTDGTPNTNFPSEKTFGIPWLRLDMMGDFVDMPINMWGAKARTAKHDGSILFYVDDYRFSALWKNPSRVSDTECTSASEVNFTVTLYTPRALVLEKVFKKRWMARYWQEKGIRIWVDLNVPTEFTEDNLLGVPDGWNAFITHGYADRLEMLNNELWVAQNKSGRNEPNFVVYGGGKPVRDWCSDNRVLYIPEASDVKRGKYKDYLNNKSFLTQRTRNKSIAQAQRVGVNG